MKRELAVKYTLIVVVAVCIAVVFGKFFVNYGFESNFIHQLPNKDNVDENIYNLLLNLYQTRLNIGNWIVAVIGAALTFIAFYVQYQYNSQQKDDLVQERYENKLFHMLDVYREICNNTTIRNVGKGKIAYHYMFYEYKALFNIIRNNVHISKEICSNDNSTINYIAFTYFINGVSANKIETSIDDKIITPKGKMLVRNLLLSYQRDSERADYANEEPGVEYLRDYSNNKIKYFDGHRLRFVPYIKYVSLVVEFIASGKCFGTENIKFLSKEQTDHEIGLIYAYHGYLKYKASLGNGQQNNEENNEQIKKLWDIVFEDIPEHMRYKFKYDGEKGKDFLS